MGPASSVPSSCAQKSIEIFGSNNNTEYFLSGEATALKFVAHESLEKTDSVACHESLEAPPGEDMRVSDVGSSKNSEKILSREATALKFVARESFEKWDTSAYTSLRMSRQPMWVSVVIKSNAVMFRFDIIQQRHLDK